MLIEFLPNYQQLILSAIDIDVPIGQQVGTGLWEVKGPYTLSPADAMRALGNPLVDITATKQGSNPPIIESTNNTNPTGGRYLGRVVLSKTGAPAEVWTIKADLSIMVNGGMGPIKTLIASKTVTHTVP